MPDQPQKRSKKSLTRRQILKTTAMAGGAIAAPYIVPSHVLGKDGATAPSEKIVLGGIGIGPRGTHDLTIMLGEKNVQFVEICDAQKSRREAVKALVDKKYGNTDCKLSSDMREFLDRRKDIDALLIATGDRWHAPAAIMAMRAGKDVYSEKPSCMTIAQGQAVVDTAKKYGRIYQTGTQRLSEAKFVFCIEMAKSGRLGKVHTARAHIAPWDTADMTHEWLPAEPCPPKEVVDWDEWLGSCPFRPYNSSYVRGGWRGHYDFHTSCIGEWGAHTFAQSQAGLNKLDTSPIEYGYVKNPTGDGMVTVFADGTKMILQREGWKGSCGMKFEGSDGWVACADGYKEPDVSDPAMLKDFDAIIKEYTEKTGRVLTGLPGGDGVVYHGRNFFDCVKTRKPTVANAEVMFHSMSTVHAANICMWLKQDMKYDPKTKTFANPEANGFVSRPMREPWVI